MAQDDTRNSGHWEAYWQGPDGQRQAVTGDDTSARLDGFLTGYFERALAARGACDIADIACGAGVVTNAASRAAEKIGVSGNRYWCVDISPAGASTAASRASPAYAIAADAAAAPFASGAFDIAASLFGVEYAGLGAFREMARLVRNGGALMAVVHRQGSPLAKECADNLALIKIITDNRLIERARAAFAAGFAIDRGGADRDAFHAADKELQPAMNSLEEAVKIGPVAPAQAFLHQVFGDLGAMYQRRQAYDPGDVTQWLDNIGGETIAFQARMKAMLTAALSRADVKAINEMLAAAGMRADDPGDLTLGAHPGPAAWIISAKR